MLSYQHHYHAGNHADVLKHWVLVECVKHLQRKEKPFDYIDTHAGAGLYDLKDPRAARLGEAASGVLRLREESAPGIGDYLAIVRPFLDADRYPGSPVVVRQLARPQDRSWLFELHPQTHLELIRNCERKGRVHVRREDGLTALPGLLPTASRRALILIDPSFELDTEDAAVVKAAAKAWRRMPGATIVIWYPVVDPERARALEARVKRSELRDVLLLELGVADEGAGRGMTGSGTIIVNPPWTLEDAARNVLPPLSMTLSIDGEARWNVRRLVDE